MKSSLMLLMALVTVAGGSGFVFCEDQPQKAARLSVQIPVEMNYLLYLPKDYDKQDAWPLLLFLHGGGERGDDLELVKMHGPPQLIEEGKQFPFLVVSPQCPLDKSFEPFELVAL